MSKKGTPVLNETQQKRREQRARRYASYRVARRGEGRADSFGESFLRLIKYLTEQKFIFTVVIIACILSTVCNVLGPNYIGDAVDVLTEQVTVKLSGGTISAKNLVPYLLTIVGIYGGMALFAYIQQYSMATATSRFHQL